MVSFMPLIAFCAEALTLNNGRFKRSQAFLITCPTVGATQAIATGASLRPSPCRHNSSVASSSWRHVSTSCPSWKSPYLIWELPASIAISVFIKPLCLFTLEYARPNLRICPGLKQANRVRLHLCPKHQHFRTEVSNLLGWEI